MYTTNLKALEAYQGVGLDAVLETATPVEIVRMLLDGFLSRVASAEGHIRRGDVAGKASAITKAINILEGLRFSLDLDRPEDLSAHLDALYEYVGLKLFEANRNSDLARLAECRDLITEVRDAWVEAHQLGVGAVAQADAA